MDLMEHLQGTGTCIYRENKATLYRYTGDEPWKGQQSYKQWLGLSKLDAKIIYIEINDRICWSKAANGTGSFNIFWQIGIASIIMHIHVQMSVNKMYDIMPSLFRR